MPDDDQDGAGDGDQGLELADPLDQPPVPFAEEGVCPGGRRGRLAEDAFEVRVALPVLPERLLAPDWMVRGDSLAHDTRCPAVGNRVMSRPISARMAWALAWEMPGMSSRRMAAGRTAASGPVPAAGPVVPSALTPRAAGIAPVSSSIRPVSVPIWALRASIWSSSIWASSA